MRTEPYWERHQRAENGYTRCVTRTVSIDRQRLHAAAATAGVDRDRAEAVWAALTVPREGEERFDAPHVAFYVGGLLVLSAFTWLMAEAWDAAGVGAALALSLGAAVALSFLSAVLLRRGWRVPGGLVATVVVALVPLIVYTFERVVGIWPDQELGEYGDFYAWISGGWFAMEVATAIAALVALRLVGFPFLVMPLAFVAWFASMDFTEVLFGEDASDNARAGVSAAFGFVMLAVGWALDLRRRRAHAFWLHLFGLMCVAGSFCYLGVDLESSWPWHAQGLLGALGLVVAVLLRRRVYAVFGGLGIVAWLGWLSSEVFADTLLFPLAVAVLGLAIMAFGIVLATHGKAWTASIAGRLPPSVQRLVPPAEV
jgi:MYXO-CTERM domain-containing protein